MGALGSGCAIRPGAQAGALSSHRRGCRPGDGVLGQGRGWWAVPGGGAGACGAGLARGGGWGGGGRVPGVLRWDACSSWHLCPACPSGGHQAGTGLVLQQKQHSLLRDQRQGGHQRGAGLPDDRPERAQAGGCLQPSAPVGTELRPGPLHLHLSPQALCSQGRWRALESGLSRRLSQLHGHRGPSGGPALLGTLLLFGVILNDSHKG